MAIPLVVGVDGSKASLEAVDWAAAEAARHGLPLHLVHCAAPGEEASGVIAAAEERVRGTGPAGRLTSDVLYEDAASALVGQGRNAFALVLGSRGRGEFADLLLGSVSLAVAARADCPVVVVRGAAEHREARFGSVVVGIEDGQGSDTAVEFAFREARARHSALVAVHAWSTPAASLPETPPGPWYTHQARRRPPAQVVEDALRGPAQRYPDTVVRRLVAEGSARQALLEAASGADLLVVGARKRRGHVGLQLGLVNHAVLHHAPCPAVVVPHR